MTAVEWLEKELMKIPFVNPKEVFEQAKEMEKQQIIDAHISGYDSSGGSADDYYTFYYGSKGSDNSPKVQNKDSFGGTSSQTEISDEEIEKAVNNPNHDAYDFREGAKWYREQLRNK